MLQGSFVMSASGPDDVLGESWGSSRAGARSGRGYRYQDAVGALEACRLLASAEPASIVPEGWEDITREPTIGPIVQMQVKSRQLHLGSFTLRAVANVINEGWEKHRHRLGAQPGSVFEVVLEAAVDDFEIEAGELAQTSLGDELRSLISVDGTSASEVLSLSRVRVEPDPMARAVAILSDVLRLPAAACVVAWQALRQSVGEAADANATRAMESRAGLGLTDIKALVDRATELVDIGQLDEAVRTGLVEALDWSSPVVDGRFYEGVDVVPGHVAAGLTVDRPQLVSAVLDGLDEGRFVLVAGPSGSGKTALAWLVANHRRAMPWYRLRRVDEASLATVMRFVAAHEPSERTPVGFVVDDVAGAPSIPAFDEFVEEALLVPGVHILGTVRNENLGIVRQARRATVVRPELDEDLAQRLFAKLGPTAPDAWPHFGEPLLLSQGLLLEYTHLLTRGERLADVVAGQVRDRRMDPARGTELRVLALVAQASSAGSAVPIDALEGAGGIDADDLPRAVSRLKDEHLVVATDRGTLVGLHQLRSEAASFAIHSNPPPSEAATYADLFRILPAPLLGPVAARATERGHLQTVADAVASSFDLGRLSAAVSGARIGAFRSEAKEWAAIAERHGVPDGLTDITYSVAIAEMDFEQLPIDDRVVAAAAEIRDLTRQPNSGAAVVMAVGGDLIARTLNETRDCALLAEALEAMVGTSRQVVESEDWPPADAVRHAIGAADLDVLERVLEALSAVDEHSATELALGNGEVLETRLACEIPWLRDLTVFDDQGVGPVASAVWLSVGDCAEESESQTNVENSVNQVAQTLLRCLPHIAEARVHAVWPDGGEVAVGGYDINRRRLRREVLVDAASRSWNQTRHATATALSSTRSHSERLAQERQLIEETAALTRDFAESWLAGRSMTHLASRLEALETRAMDLGPAPAPAEATSMAPDQPVDLRRTNPGDRAVVDVLKHVIPGLSRGSNYRSTASVIGRQLDRLSATTSKEYWQLVGLEEAPACVDELIELLEMLQVIAYEVGLDASIASRLRRAARSGHRGGALRRASRVAQSRVAQRFDRICSDALARAEDADLALEVITVPEGPDSPWMPSASIVLLCPTESVVDYVQSLDTLRGIKASFEGRRVWTAPVRAGLLVEPFIGAFIGDGWYPNSPDLVAVRGVADLPPSARLPTFELISDILDALLTISAIDAWSVDPQNVEEERVLQSALRRFEESRDALLALETSDPLLEEALLVLQTAAERVSEEGSADVPRETCFGADMVSLVRGTEPEGLMASITGVKLLLAEWDIDPAAAGELLARFDEEG